MNDNELLLAAVREFPPDDEAELVNQLPVLLQGRSIQDMVLLRRRFLDNKSDVVVAQEFGLAATSISLKCEELKFHFQALRDVRQPPHAAD